MKLSRYRFCQLNAANFVAFLLLVSAVVSHAEDSSEIVRFSLPVATLIRANDQILISDEDASFGGRQAGGKLLHLEAGILVNRGVLQKFINSGFVMDLNLLGILSMPTGALTYVISEAKLDFLREVSRRIGGDGFV